MTTPIHVVSGLFLRAGRMFMTRRSSAGQCPGMWELPGGKVEYGETPEQALVRELKEELDVTACVGKLLGHVLLQWRSPLLIGLYTVSWPEAAHKLQVGQTAASWLELDQAYDSMPCVPGVYSFYDVLADHIAEVNFRV